MLRLRNRRRRRGLALMIVLSLLVLFLLLGVSFMMVASQTEKGARAQAKTELKRDNPKRLLDMAMYDVVIGPRSLNSAIVGHGLLRDMYGTDGFSGQVDAWAPVPQTGRQFIQVHLGISTLRDFSTSPKSYSLTPISGYYNGRVLTFVSGDAKGASVRIVGYNATTGNFLVMAPETDNTATALAIAAGDRVVVNGQPFSGTGFDYDDSNGKLGAQALYPNRLPPPLGFGNLSQYLRGAQGVGDADESYDAPDLQNLALAAVMTDPNSSLRGNLMVLPSFHRPALINYLMTNSPKWPDPNFRRGSILRPMPWDHPGFTGSNPAFTVFARGSTWTQGPDGGWGKAGMDDDKANGTDDPGEAGYPGTDDVNSLLFGPWDVDNDNDGMPDSVWLDFGVPVQTSESGRMYKPLFAVLCLDMDGKLNVNAHGNRWHIAPKPEKTTEMLAAGTPSSKLPIGEGYGPAEISFLGSVPGVPPALNSTEYGRLLFGDATYPGRYGADQRAGKKGLDPFGLVKFFEYPNNYFTPTFTSFGTPDNLEGRLAFGLDSRGLLRYERSTSTDNRADAAYEIDLSLDAPRGYSAGPAKDQPYSAAELESLLRSKDLDARELPARMRHLLASAVASQPNLAQIITTDSYDLPVPNTPDLWNLRQQLNYTFKTYGKEPQVKNFRLPRPQALADLIVVQMINRLLPNYFDLDATTSPPDDQITLAELNAMLGTIYGRINTLRSPAMSKGTAIDLNRPFGNGIDDNGNGVIDEHHWQILATDAQNLAVNESWGNEVIWKNVLGAYFDHDNDGVVRSAAPPGGTPDTNAFLARQQMAKDLFVLMLTLKDPSHQIDFDRNPGNNSPEETIRGIAQWCINVVDFRDADSIMTPFEYDVRPFNGWNVDGVIGSGDDGSGERRLVWGCERPELLISETIAWHARRTEDLDVARKVDDGDPKTKDDDDYDQRLLPRGAFFVELYNPWAGDDRFPAELYDYPARRGVDLRKVNAFNAPVWRMIIVKSPSGKLKDPDVFDPHDRKYGSRLLPAEIDRSIYFADPAPAGITGHGMPFYPDKRIRARIAPLRPGRYAVVGSSGVEDPSGSFNFVNTIGRRTDADEAGGDLRRGQTRQIRLHPDANPNTDQVVVLNNQNPGAPDSSPPTIPPVTPPATFARPPVIGIPINLPRSFSVSEPLPGYPLVDKDGNPIGANPAGEPMYNSPYDQPFDNVAPLKDNGTSGNYCVVHLQRLANPLAPWHKDSNPYLTIDSMSSDITAFNGVTNDHAGNPNDDPNASTTNKFFATLERGVSDGAGILSRQLWNHQPSRSVPNNNVVSGIGDHYLNWVLTNSIGYLNRSYGPIANLPGNPQHGFPDTSTKSPFPWMQWNNRPFVSQYELASVPRSKSFRLSYDYSVYNTSAGTDPYRVTPSAFGHLLNFFETSDGANKAKNAAHFYRLFDYTYVPSKFVGAETWLNPTAFRSGLGTDGWHAPFNGVPEFREPGKVNINTIYDQRVWNAIVAGHPAPSFGQVAGRLGLVDSRRGYLPAGGILQFDSRVPTFFANPFRGAGEGDYVPPVATTSPNYSLMQRKFGVEATLARSVWAIPAPPPTPTPTDPQTTLQNQRPLLERTTTNQYDDFRRNPYFQNQPTTRLENLLTTRSNVYAIWITVGFFEVNPATGTLGKELGSDTGEVERHRAFYMVDRSIPVAYEPGENHNVDRAILVRRFIE